MAEQQVLVILSPGFPSDEKDTTCLPAQQLFVRSLNKVFPGLRVMIISLQYPYRSDRYLWFGNTVIALNGKRIPKYLRPWLWLKAYHHLYGIHRSKRIIGILSFWCQETALIGNYFARWNNLIHKIWVKGQDARRKNFFVRMIRPKSEALIALSESLSAQFEKNHGVRPLWVIPNGVDESMFTGQPALKDIDVLGVGSLIPLKQYHIFLQVIQVLVRINPHLKVVLIGAGPEEQSLRDDIRHMRLTDNVMMPGEVPHAEVIRCMERSKMLLHPSSYEGYSTVCIEALFAGCHVVSFTSAQNSAIDHWHVVANTDEMIGACIDLLVHKPDYTPVLVNTMDESARKMLALFGEKVIVTKTSRQ